MYLIIFETMWTNLIKKYNQIIMLLAVCICNEYNVSTPYAYIYNSQLSINKRPEISNIMIFCRLLYQYISFPKFRHVKYVFVIWSYLKYIPLHNTGCNWFIIQLITQAETCLVFTNQKLIFLMFYLTRLDFRNVKWISRHL